ncbi:MAG: ATP-binding protein [Lachnospiraceae bacterium]|nr:ATP-binding protein [Lachnospiraceae bacterium]
MENNYRCRFQKITINNLKNVGHGEVCFSCNLNEDVFCKQADILGIYGQNGSGKTTLIFAIDLLQQLLSGRRLWSDSERFIRVGEESAEVEYEFSLENSIYGQMLVKYGVTLKKKENTDVVSNVEGIEEEDHVKESPVYVSQEYLKYKKIDGDKGNSYSGIVVYTYGDKPACFSPDVRFKEFISKDKTLADDLRYVRSAIYKSGASFIFSIARIKNVRERQGFSDEILFVMNSIQMFAVSKLFVLSNVQASIVNANIVLPMTFSMLDKDNKSFSQVNIRIKLTDETAVDTEFFEMISKRFGIIDSVISKIVPNLSIKVANRGNRIDEKGVQFTIFELLSVRNEKEIPLRYESDGIKKLVYILYGLIEMFNDESVTVAIDELDSGVFEYLLGEMLTVLQEYAKGQLIFTSHNLRALEVLDKRNVIFSTTNPVNRYIRFKYVKGTNNLRDVYYQDILLGGQDECVYEPTSQSDMRRAFRKAGIELNG